MTHALVERAPARGIGVGHEHRTGVETGRHLRANAGQQVVATHSAAMSASIARIVGARAANSSRAR